MATRSSELLHYVNEHVLECSICAEQLKNPKTLSCLHVFCCECIGMHIQNTIRQNRYKCPLCNEEHILPSDGIKSLRDAFLQKSLLEVANLIQKKKMACSSCEEGHEANSACATCGELLCNDCSTVHKKHKMTRNHDLVPIFQLQDTQKVADFQKVRYTMCTQHDAEVCKLYCNKDETQICHTFTFDPKHKGHDIITLDAKLAELKAGVNETKRNLEDKILELKSKCEIVSSAMADIQREEKSALDTMSTRVNALEEMIRTYKTKVTQQIKASAATGLKDLQPLHKKLTSDIERLKIVRETNILDSLPAPTAIHVANYVIKQARLPTIGHLNQADFEEKVANIKFTVSTLEYESVDAVLKSVVGFVPGVIRKEAPYAVNVTDMPEKMKATSTSNATEVMEQWHALVRRRSRGNLVVIGYALLDRLHRLDARVAIAEERAFR